MPASVGPQQVLIQVYILCSHSGIENLADITTYLHSLGRTAVFNLGLILGLDYNRLKPLIDSPDFLADVLAGWLQRVDQVQKAGVPTWRRLVEVLRDPRVGQNGIASNIEQDKLWTKKCTLSVPSISAVHYLKLFHCTYFVKHFSLYPVFHSIVLCHNDTCLRPTHVYATSHLNKKIIHLCQKCSL